MYLYSIQLRSFRAGEEFWTHEETATSHKRALKRTRILMLSQFGSTYRFVRFRAERVCGTFYNHMKAPNE